jgi:adenosylcobinamide-GDP ribazoletransferase
LNERSGLQPEIKSLIFDTLCAFSLLTILPIPFCWLDAQRAPARAMAAYPLVGFALGLVLTLTSVLFQAVLPSLVASGLTIVAWALLTGGLHLDGWADCCDALTTPVSRERRLEILKDPRLGSFGGVGLVLLLLVKFAAIAALPRASAALILAPTLGRWAIVNVAAMFPLARPDGMAVHFRAGLSRRELGWSALTAAVVCGLAGWVGLTALVAAAITALAFGRWATVRLGGVTGDVYGATCELVECVVLVLASLPV